MKYFSGYNDLKSELTDYLKKFADSNKVSFRHAHNCFCFFLEPLAKWWLSPIWSVIRSGGNQSQQNGGFKSAGGLNKMGGDFPDESLVY